MTIRWTKNIWLHQDLSWKLKIWHKTVQGICRLVPYAGPGEPCSAVSRHRQKCKIWVSDCIKCLLQSSQSPQCSFRSRKCNNSLQIEFLRRDYQWITYQFALYWVCLWRVRKLEHSSTRFMAHLDTRRVSSVLVTASRWPVHTGGSISFWDLRRNFHIIRKGHHYQERVRFECLESWKKHQTLQPI